MEDSIRRKLEKFEREQAFMTDSAADFPAGSPGGDAAVVHTAIIDELRDLAATQVSEGGEAAQAFTQKENALDDMMTIIRNMNRAANAFSDEIPGSKNLFRMPRNRSQQSLLATGRAFHEDSAGALTAKFVSYGLAGTFRADLQSAINAVDTAATSADTSEGQRAAATGGLADAARRGMTNSRKLDAIVRIKYQNDPQKLAGWTVASHLEKAPQTQAAPTP